jgi:hypothetical protein
MTKSLIFLLKVLPTLGTIKIEKGTSVGSRVPFSSMILAYDI